ncbi:MAG TPA: hypothetical protein VFA71_01530 [Terriglobales bacterium]|nr:hypothetical protein [Terriglobales bacterium]
MSQLKPGGMGSTSDPPNAKPGDFANSMADAMEHALNTLLSNDGMNTFKVDTNSQEARDRRRLFVAIAQGVVRHLKDNAGAMVIKDSLNNVLNEHIDIQVDGTLL